MAVVGLSLILASVIYLVFRRPPLVQTLLAFWRRDPRIDQPPSTASPRAGTPPAEREARDDEDDGATPRPPVTITTTGADDDDDQDGAPARPAVVIAPPAEPLITTTLPDDEGGSSTQTTPKATAAAGPTPTSSVPSFSLSPSPPASAASQARATAAGAVNARHPPAPAVLGPPAPVVAASSSASSSSSLMMPPPPPRPPTLNTINNGNANTNSLSPAPQRGAPAPYNLANATRQPGTSTLAPPPTHSSKPAKPSRKVILTPGHSPLDWARLAQGPTSDLRNLPAGTPYLKVTPSMLRRQTGRRGKDAWTVFGGRVYNTTPYLPFHPGGEPELLRVAGRDGTRLFGEIHPWVNYEGMLASSLIGMLVEEGEEQKNEMDAMD